MGLGAAIPFIKGLAPKPIDPADVGTAVADYLEDHPEATCPIDDTAGEGDTGKVWSADKSAGEVATLSEAIAQKPDTSMFAKLDTVTETSANKFDKDAAQVGYLHSNGNVYTGGSYDNYSYGFAGNVNEGDIVKFYADTLDYVHAENVQFVAAYDGNGNVLSTKGASSVNTYTVPEGVKSIKVTMLSVAVDHFMSLINPEAMPDEYIPYTAGSQYYVAGEGFIPKSAKIAINLPSKLYALTGYELNVYFENLVENYEDYDWNCECEVGMQLERGYRITPTDSNAGNHTLTITATAKDGTESKATTTLVCVAESAGTGTTETVIVLGDSTTANGQMVTKLAGNFSDDAMSITLAGTRGTSPNLHEGRGGWTFNKYFTVAQDPLDSSILNPFYNSTSQTFDAEYYFANSGVNGTDWFFINLGINDVFATTKDSTLDTQIASCIEYCWSMIESIKGADENIKVGVCLTIPPNHSQDAFGKAYACSQTRNRYKKNNARLVKAFIDEFDGYAAQGVYVVPIHVNLDTVNNMGMETIAVNARNATTYSSPIGNGGVHPVESGYWQIADVITALIKACAGN